MRAVLQRVSRASVEVSGERVGVIERGLVMLLGIAEGDSERDADYLANKVAHLRIFPDKAGKMNLSVMEVGGSILLISQFTLYGDCRKGRRPSFDAAAPPGEAKRLYDYLIKEINKRQIPLATGIFQADMQVSLVNDGPITLILESKESLGVIKKDNTIV